jgi:hypothetical protein
MCDKERSDDAHSRRMQRLPRERELEAGRECREQAIAKDGMSRAGVPSVGAGIGDWLKVAGPPRRAAL